jgi:hypothetical protein
MYSAMIVIINEGFEKTAAKIMNQTFAQFSTQKT